MKHIVFLTPAMIWLVVQPDFPKVGSQMEWCLIAKKYNCDWDNFFVKVTRNILLKILPVPYLKRETTTFTLNPFCNNTPTSFLKIKRQVSIWSNLIIFSHWSIFLDVIKSNQSTSGKTAVWTQWPDSIRFKIQIFHKIFSKKIYCIRMNDKRLKVLPCNFYYFSNEGKKFKEYYVINFRRFWFAVAGLLWRHFHKNFRSLCYSFLTHTASEERMHTVRGHLLLRNKKKKCKNYEKENKISQSSEESTATKFSSGF